jgi:hypothetical protein
MSQFVIAVRSYQRADLFATRTLRVLQRHGLTDRTTLFVGSDPDPYRKHCTIPIVPVPVGGANAIRSICDYYARATPIFFIDDDMGEFYRYDVSSGEFVGDGLVSMIEEGFRTADYFTFGFTTNRLWLREGGAD